MDFHLVQYPSNIYSFADFNPAYNSTSTPIVSLSVASSGKEVKVAGLSKPIVFTIPHTGTATTTPYGFVPRCRYWNTGKNGWGYDGCSVDHARSNENFTTCSCTQLTAFNVENVAVPPVIPSKWYLYDLVVAGGYALVLVGATWQVLRLQQLPRPDVNLFTADCRAWFGSLLGQFQLVHVVLAVLAAMRGALYFLQSQFGPL